jgi:sugar lactone lactonase YvrE
MRITTLTSIVGVRRPREIEHMRGKTIAALVALVTLAVATAAVAQTFPRRLNLPNGWQPEGIAAGGGDQLFVGSRANGAVVRVNSRTGRSRIIVAGRRGRSATGLKRSGNRLFVSGAGTGRAWVYDARTGRQIKAFRLAPPGRDTFVNDVVVTTKGAYFTDSSRNALYVVPRDLSRPHEIALRGIPLQAGNNLNGIVATADRRTLISVQTNTGRLWRIDPATGRGTRIHLGGGSVANGDGLLLRGRTLYVVCNQSNRIAVVRLSADLSSGRVTRTIRSRAFDVPTTVARIDGRLYAVNARFGTTPTARTRYWIIGVAA